jgi:hypothetical protein
MTHCSSALSESRARDTHEGDKVGHGSGKDTKDTGKEEGRVPCNSSTVFVSQVLKGLDKDLPDDITGHSPESSTKDQTTV